MNLYEKARTKLISTLHSCYDRVWKAHAELEDKVQLVNIRNKPQFNISPPELSEVKEVMKKARSGSVPGSNGVPYYIYKYTPGARFT